jgi:NAD(P)-dependent dehydrogenase (short-subunit alcohol dehydrogenase family)
MREARSGCIVNVTSVAGQIAFSPLGAYAASKYALEAISEAVAGEVKPFQIRVAIVQPGMQDTKTGRAVLNVTPSAYSHSRRFAGLVRAAYANPVSPIATAEVIRQIIESDTWQLRHPAGPDAQGFLNWRAAMSDEQWVGWSAQNDEAWYEQVEREFGLNARPEVRAARSGDS